MEWGQSVDRAKENEIYIYDMIYDDDDNSIVNPEPGKLPHTTLNK